MDKIAESIVLQYSDLGRAIRPDDIDDLVSDLASRLGCDQTKLDYSSDSLRFVGEELVNYYKKNPRGQIEEKDLVKLIREIAAYTGESFVKMFEGKWVLEALNLWASSVTIDKPITTFKVDKIRRSKKRGYPAVRNAAYFWDMVEKDGIENFFFDEYENMKKNVWVERL